MSFKEVIENVRGLYSLDQSKWERRVTGLEPTELLRELNSNRKILSINQRLMQAEGTLAVLGLVIGAGSNSPELAFGSVGVLIPILLLHGRPGIVLEKRINFIGLEVSSRRDQAIFYQDVETLNNLDALNIIPF